MKKFLLTLCLISILSIFSTFCFADGSYTDASLGYNYSITYKSVIGNVVVLQSKSPIFLNGNAIYTKGDYKYYSLSGSVAEGSGTSVSYITNFTYFEILEASTDLIDYITKQVVYQAGQKDIVGLSQDTINQFLTHLTNLENLSIGTFVVVILIFCYFVSNSIFGLLRKG